MKYILTENIVVPAGTVFEVSDSLEAGGLETLADRGFMRVFLGRAEALRLGMVVAKPELALVETPAECASLTVELIQRAPRPTSLMKRAFSIPMSLLIETLILPQRAR